MDKQPTQEQIKEFWEWCGIKYQHYSFSVKTNEKIPDAGWVLPDGEFHFNLPIIDLNNLFKYAVPKLHKKYTHLDILFEHGVHGNITTNCTIKFSNYITGQMEVIGKGEAYDKDPALALFWAIWESKEE